MLEEASQNTETPAAKRFRLNFDGSELEVLTVSDGENEHEQPQSNAQKTGRPEDPIWRTP